jgi:hypothetical protein
MQLRPYQAAYALTSWAFAPSLYLGYKPRLGKTFAEVTAESRRQLELGTTRTVVIGPKKPLQMTWVDHLRAAGLVHYDLTSGTVVERGEMLRDPDLAPGIVLVNFEVLEQYVEPIEAIIPGKCYAFRGKEYRDDLTDERNPGKALERARMARRRSNCKTICDLLVDWNPDTLIIDEAHLIASPSADRSRALRRLARKCRFVRLLSGTPDPRKAVSFYPQYVILDPDIFGTSKTRFLEKYFIMSPVIRGKVEKMREETAPEFWAKAHSVMQVVNTEDYFGPDNPPPPVIRTLDWPEKAAQTYRAFVKDSVLAGDLVLDGTHRLTKEMRCAQMAAGFAVDEQSGEAVRLHSEKEDAIIADLAEILAGGMRCVISYLFTLGGEAILEAVAKAYGKESVALINGHTNDRVAVETLRLFDANNTTETPLKVLIVQEKVGGVGISLARANYLMFHSWSMDAADHEQMRLRIWSPDRPANYTYYQMKNSVDQSRRRVVQEKQDASIMHRNFAQFLEGNL